MSVFEFENVCLGYGDHAILDQASCQLNISGITCLVGASGQGKSTLLRTLNRLNDHVTEFHMSGVIRFQGQSIYDPSLDVTQHRRDVGMIMQRPVVFHGSIFENVIFGLRPLLKRQRGNLPEIAERVLRHVCLWDEVKDRLGQSAHVLSIGQQQRLAIARALAVEPKVLLMDEPTSALDPQAEEGIEELMTILKKDMPIICVTHKQPLVCRISDYTVSISDEQLHVASVREAVLT